MKKTFGMRIPGIETSSVVLAGIGIAAALFGAIPAGRAADMPKMQGNWSTWGCNVSWFGIDNGKLTRYSKEEKLPNDIVDVVDAKITDNGGKVDIDYKDFGSKYKEIYDVNGNKLLLDRLLVDNNVVFNRQESKSPFKDKPTERCSPAA